MIVLIPHANSTHIHAVEEAICNQGYGSNLFDVSRSDTAYWEMLEGVWGPGPLIPWSWRVDYGDDICIVEHDNLVPAGALDALATCPSDWCALPYGGGVYKGYVGMGCVKFSAALMRRNPTALAETALYGTDENHPPKHWCRIDNSLQRIVLAKAGEQRCEHWEYPLEPLDGTNSHRCLHQE